MEDKYFLMGMKGHYMPVPMSMYKFFRQHLKQETNPKMKGLTHEEATALCKLLNNGEEAPEWMRNDGA